ncbi:MAG: hypothetical protein RBT78_08370 [Kiritimatiellia bacterium]|nr:hypothetical protein [Kiritimatiellia bacterium]
MRRLVLAMIGHTVFAVHGALAMSTGDSARAFIWEQANAQIAAAATPEAYQKAAETYNRLVADNVRNGPLFLNLGNALVMAGDGLNAAAAFNRAERHLGATPETRQGLAAALALQSGRAQTDLPWDRIAFVWHYAFPCRIRALTALCGWSLFWLGVLCRIGARRRERHTFLRSLAETCMLTGGLLAVVFAASTLITLAQERHDAATWGARIFTASTPETEGTP